MSDELVKHAANKAKQHTVYKNKAGTRVPGVTTITGVMDKPALVKWANRLGLQGIEVEKYVDELATIGTCCHLMIECHDKGVKPDLSDFTPNQVGLAENGYIKYMEWCDQVGYESIWAEKQLVSEKHQFGGTIDGYGVMKKQGDKRIQRDIKTCKGVYDDQFTQVAGGYGILLEENGFPVQEHHIVRVGRNPDEGFEAVLIPLVSEHVERFLICRSLYECNKKVKRW
jgi:hypothetical protein